MFRSMLLSVLIGALLCVSNTVAADPRVLTDEELAEITGGFDICSLFGITGSCAVSFGQTFDASGETELSTAAPLHQDFSSNQTGGGINQTVIIDFSGGSSSQINRIVQ